MAAKKKAKAKKQVKSTPKKGKNIDPNDLTADEWESILNTITSYSDTLTVGKLLTPMINKIVNKCNQARRAEAKEKPKK